MIGGHYGQSQLGESSTKRLEVIYVEDVTVGCFPHTSEEAEKRNVRCKAFLNCIGLV